MLVLEITTLVMYRDKWTPPPRDVAQLLLMVLCEGTRREKGGGEFFWKGQGEVSVGVGKAEWLPNGQRKWVRFDSNPGTHRQLPTYPFTLQPKKGRG